LSIIALLLFYDLWSPWFPEGFAFALPVSFALGAIDCPFKSNHRRGYITEGYVCDVWQCIA